MIMDSCRGTGDRATVPPQSKAVIAAVAHSLVVEVHCDPQKALNDGLQTLRPDRFDEMVHELLRVALAVGADLPLPERPLP